MVKININHIKHIRERFECEGRLNLPDTLPKCPPGTREVLFTPEALSELLDLSLEVNKKLNLLGRNPGILLSAILLVFQLQLKRPVEATLVLLEDCEYEYRINGRPSRDLLEDFFENIVQKEIQYNIKKKSSVCFKFYK